MTKKALLLGLGLCALWPRWCAAVFTPMQNRGAVEQATMTAISVSTTATIAISTGSNFVEPGALGPSIFGAVSVVGFGTSSGITVAPGQFLRERMYVEFFNDTSTDVWIGFDSNLSTSSRNGLSTFTGGTNYARRIPPGSAWSNDGSLKEYWVKAATTTENRFVITQQK